MAYASAMNVLGDPTRRAVLESLRAGPRSVGEIAGRLPVSRPAVSQHLKALKAAGLVTDEAAGTRRVYRVDPAGFEEVRAYVESFWRDVLGTFEKAAKQEAKAIERRRKIKAVGGRKRR